MPSLYRIGYLISLVPRKVKWFFQRGFRGYADCDTWNIDGWFCKVLPKMLKQYRDETVCLWSHLMIESETEEEAVVKQNEILDKMIFLVENMDPDRLWEDVKEDYQKEYKEEFFELFKKYFYALWW